MSARPNGKRIASAEATLLDTIQRDLYTAVISDALDELEIRHQAMREYVRPLAPDAVYAGWARTILCMDVYYTSENPYALEIEAIDSILEDEVVVVATHSSVRNAPWGELLSTAAQARGARGAVVDGLVRDVKKILSLGFPVHASGVKPVDSRGRGEVVDYNVPVQCGDVLVNPNDLVVADYDGVVVIPAAAVERTIQLATEKVAREDHSRADLKKGAYLRDVFDKYGVL
jgi:4-hydroxy-4-methyl-2-oxoglutarate aldolase